MAGESGEGEVGVDPSAVAPYRRGRCALSPPPTRSRTPPAAALPPELWDYVSGGGGTEVTLRAQPEALDAVFAPPAGGARRVGRAARTRRSSGSSSPRRCCSRRSGRSGCSTRAARRRVPARRRGRGPRRSSPSSRPRRSRRSRATGAPLIFQHYTRGSRAWTLELFRRAESAGYRAICVTVDSPVDGLRERELRHRFDRGRGAGAAEPRRRRPARAAGRADLERDRVARRADRAAAAAQGRDAPGGRGAGAGSGRGGADRVQPRRAPARCAARRRRGAPGRGRGGRRAGRGARRRRVRARRRRREGARAGRPGGADRRAMCFSLAAGGEDTLVETLERLRRRGRRGRWRCSA